MLNGITENRIFKKFKDTKAFSLIEIIIALAVIAIIILIAMPDLRNVLFNSRVTACESDVKVIGDAVMKYYAEMGELPDVAGIEELKEELTRDDIERDGRKVGPWMTENMNTKDPWGNDYEWKNEGGSKYDICSGGDPASPRDICYRSLGRKVEEK